MSEIIIRRKLIAAGFTVAGADPVLRSVASPGTPASNNGADGVVAHTLGFGMRIETWLVSDHPVCAG